MGRECEMAQIKMQTSPQSRIIKEQRHRGQGADAKNQRIANFNGISGSYDGPKSNADDRRSNC